MTDDDAQSYCPPPGMVRCHLCNDPVPAEYEYWEAVESPELLAELAACDGGVLVYPHSVCHHFCGEHVAVMRWENNPLYRIILIRPIGRELSRV